MRIVLSPAKNMKEQRAEENVLSRPVFSKETEEIYHALCALTEEERRKLWACNDKIAQVNEERLRKMNPLKGTLKAVDSYDGMVYKRLHPALEKEKSRMYIEEHVRILSGFYGVLSPTDGINLYRLEMQAKLQVGNAPSLYAFWGSKLHDEIFRAEEPVMNLASSEYDRCLKKYLQPQERMVTCIFGEWKNGKVITKSTAAKTARGEMVRWLAENGIVVPEDAKGFAEAGYRYVSELSNENEYVFLQNL